MARRRHGERRESNSFFIFFSLLNFEFDVYLCFFFFVIFVASSLLIYVFFFFVLLIETI